jgi:hypothetical protein
VSQSLAEIMLAIWAGVIEGKARWVEPDGTVGCVARITVPARLDKRYGCPRMWLKRLAHGDKAVE